MQYHEVRVTFEFEDAANIPGIDTTAALSAELWCDYVYLDQEERKKFATQSHEYLVEQIGYTGDENVTIGTTQKSQQVRLSFNHPTKLLAFCVSHPTTYGQVTGVAPGGITTAAVTAEAAAPIATVKLLLNGHDRAAVRTGAVYNKIVPYQANKARPDAGYYYMSFALSPTQHAPSGSLNFSRIDSAVLQLTFKAAKSGATAIANVTNENETLAATADLTQLRVMSVNFNILRIMSGMPDWPNIRRTSSMWSVILCPTASCRKSSEHDFLRVNSGTARQSYHDHTIAYNSLVSFFEKKLATPSIAGTSLEPHLRSLSGNRECQGRVMTSLTVKTMWIGRSAGTRLRALLTSIRRPLRDCQAVGSRKLNVAFDDGLRYSPSACESMRVMPGEGSVIHHE